MDSGKIHIVDDGNSYSRLFEVLKNDPYAFKVTKDPSRAIEEISLFDPDLIIIEIHMSEKKGIKLCRQLKSTPELEQIPILFMAVSGYPYLVSQAYKAGARDFIAKPFSPTETPLRIRTHIDLVHSQKGEREALKREHRALEKAQQASKIKSQFLAVMSHEIRTPLNAVIGFTDLMMEETLSSQQNEMLMTIKRSSDTLLSLVNDILDITKIEADQMEIELQPFDLPDIMYDAAEMARSKLAGNTVEVNVDIQLDCEQFVNDATKLRQIFTNLMSNAVKFTHRGEVLLRARVQQKRSHIHTVRFEVIDTGIGMTPDQCKYVFEPFRQADSSTTRKYGGTGLGLSISKGLIKCLGGELQLISEFGKGTKFFFDLDMEIQYENIKKPTTNLNEVNLLILDDNPSSLKILCYQAENLGMNVEAYLGQDDFHQLRQIQSYDIALIDSELPNSFDFARQIIAEGICRHCLAMTPNYDHEMTLKIKKSVFENMLCKPVRPSTIVSTCGSLLKKDLDKLTETQPLEFSGSPLEILVAEDNVTNQKLIKIFLEKMGHKVDLVFNGNEAVEAVKIKEYDVIFMDMQMPILGGVEATRIIRQNKNINQMPIIAMTANAMEHFREECLQAGMDDFMSKPIRKDTLWQKLEDNCGRNMPLLDSQPRILVIEDDESTRNAISYILSSNFPTVSYKMAQDGMEACTLIGSFNPDLILTDLLMPRMDGEEFIKFMKYESDYDSVIIVMTNLQEDDEKSHAVKKLGIDDFKTKPINRQELVTCLKHHLSKKIKTKSI